MKNEELKKLEEDLPRLQERGLMKAARAYKATKTGVGCDGFHPKVPLDLAVATRRQVVEFGERGGAEREMTAASLHNDVLPDPKKCHE